MGSSSGVVEHLEEVFSYGNGAEMAKRGLCVRGLGVAQTKEVQWIPVATRSFLTVTGLRFYAWSVPGPRATTVNRYSPAAFREPTVWQERQTLKQFTSVLFDKCSGSESSEALKSCMDKRHLFQLPIRKGFLRETVQELSLNG